MHDDDSGQNHALPLQGGEPASASSAGAEPGESALDFEALLGRLEAIVTRLEQEQPSLEESLELFEKGMELARSGEQVLERAQARIDSIVAVAADGGVQVAPLEPR